MEWPRLGWTVCTCSLLLQLLISKVIDASRLRSLTGALPEIISALQLKLGTPAELADSFDVRTAEAAEPFWHEHRQSAKLLRFSDGNKPWLMWEGFPRLWDSRLLADFYTWHKLANSLLEETNRSICEHELARFNNRRFPSKENFSVIIPILEARLSLLPAIVRHLATIPSVETIYLGTVGHGLTRITAFSDRI